MQKDLKQHAFKFLVGCKENYGKTKGKIEFSLGKYFRDLEINMLKLSIFY